MEGPSRSTGFRQSPRRRKRESVSREEHIIDGCTFVSFVSFEAMKMDRSLKPSQRTDIPCRRNKGKRGSEQNGGGWEPEGASSYWNKP